MYTIVFDLEWNMAGYTNRVPDHIKKDLPFEIIEIGAVKLDHTLTPVDTFTAWIRPQVYTVLDAHVAKLTGRTEETLTEGRAFPDVMKDFYAWVDQVPQGSGDYPNPLEAMSDHVKRDAQTQRYFYATWSNSDTGPLRDNLRWHGLEDHLPARCLNVQKLFTKIMEPGSGQQRSIAHALEVLDIPLDGTHHRALTDATHTASILRALAGHMTAMTQPTSSEPGTQASDAPVPQLKEGLDRLPIMPLMDRLWSYTYNPNLTYQSREPLGPAIGLEQTLELIHALEPVCPDCSTPLIEQRSWKVTAERSTAKAYVARYQCPDHGPVVGTVRLRRNKEGTWFGQQTFRLHRPLEL